MPTEFTRIAIIDKDKCQPKSCNYLCRRLCPLVRMDEDVITIDEKTKLPAISEALCSGCGICINRCPRKAIQIINTGIKTSEPIHQYGKNQFRLFSLPVIETGSITGIIGQNGAGKTTAINILSGSLIPNLGNYDTKGNIDKVIEYYKGKSIQSYFLEIKNKKMAVAYKIQKVEDIPKYFNKRIIDLLTASAGQEKENVKKIIKELQIENIINKTPQEISGGELQRVAIAATILKNAKLYFFDEFTTFLDIKQRFNVARILRSQLSEDKTIMLIEHDLAILDYASDFVQIMAGKKNAYGISSNKKTTKNGINEFLDGFLKDENLKIRDHEIVFASARDKKTVAKTALINYPKLKIKIGSFSLEVSEGTINNAEVIGIIGANATGKTTFMKMLSGELKPDNTAIDLKLKIAYKPQYIDYDKEIQVSEIFSGKEIDNELFNAELRNQLDIDSIYDQKIGELSGGELQKIAIAHTLSKTADIYLIDEPSAFLDVEQRLVVANIIKSVINKMGRSAFVVDHDLLFIDYISDRALLFEGMPSMNGTANEITDVATAFNKFLKEQGITFRQDPQTKRPRANKPDSQKDQEQKKENKYYYTI